MTAALDWAGDPVPVADIERELRRRRATLAAERAVPLIRASVMNLVVVTPGERVARRAFEAVEALGPRTPSRCVLLITDPTTAGPAVQAWIRLLERHAGTRSQVGWEQVVVRAGVPPRHLTSVVLPLLLPELPVFTWWAGTPPLDGEVFEELLEVTDRLVVDSADFAAPWPDLADLGQALWWIHPPVSDSAWGRLTSWREVLAGWFEGPALRGAWDRVRRVRVDAAEPTAGLLLVGWLASRLGWRLLDGRLVDETLVARYATSYGNCAAAIAQSFAHGGIAAVELAVATAEGTATMRVHAADDHLGADVRLPGGERTRRSFGVQLVSGHSGLVTELQVYGRDLIYEQALRAAGELAVAAVQG